MTKTQRWDASSHLKILERSVSDKETSKCRGPGTRPTKAYDPKRPVFLEQRAGESGGLGAWRGRQGPCSGKPASESMARIWDVFVQIVGNHSGAFSKRVNLVHSKTAPVYFLPLGRESW